MNNKSSYYDTLSLAGLAVMQGVPMGEAMSQAAMTQYNMQHAQQLQQEQQQAQFMAQRLPQVLRNLEGKSPYEAAAMLQESGMEAKDIALLLEKLGFVTDSQKASRTFAGPNGMRYQEVKNPETGELEARMLPGQEPRHSAQEIKAETDLLTEANAEAAEGAGVMQLLKQAAPAYQQLEKHSNWFTKPGSFLSRFTDPVATEDSYIGFAREAANNFFYDEKARAAKEQIGKLNSHLLQNTIKNNPARAGTDLYKKEIRRGYPGGSNTTETQQKLLVEENERGAFKFIKGKFLNEWKKSHGSVEGAPEAFLDFIRGKAVVDKSGEVNNKTVQEAQTAARSNQSGDWKQSYAQFPDDAVAAEIARQEQLKKQGK